MTRGRIDSTSLVTFVIWACVCWPSFLPLLLVVLWLPSGRQLQDEVSQANPHTAHPLSDVQITHTHTHTVRQMSAPLKSFPVFLIYIISSPCINSHLLMWFCISTHIRCGVCVWVFFCMVLRKCSTVPACVCDVFFVYPVTFHPFIPPPISPALLLLSHQSLPVQGAGLRQSPCSVPAAMWMWTQQQLQNTGTSDKPGERTVCPPAPTPLWVRALTGKFRWLIRQSRLWSACAQQEMRQADENSI